MNWKKIVVWLARIWVAVIFGIHGVQALFGNSEMVGYFDFVGLPVWLLYGVAFLDLTVAVLVLYKPLKALALWTVFWPILPTTVDFLVNPTGTIHFVEHLFSHSLPGLVFFVTSFTGFLGWLEGRKRES